MAETGFDRILVCKHHGVMYKMRPYDGPPEYDQELIELCNRHNAQCHQHLDQREALGFLGFHRGLFMAGCLRRAVVHGEGPQPVCGDPHAAGAGRGVDGRGGQGNALRANQGLGAQQHRRGIQAAGLRV